MKYLIVGLGNIGAEYDKTRHNIGFDVLDAIAKDKKVSFESAKLATKAEVTHKGKKLILIKPTTYMNLSGKTVRYWMNELNIPKQNVLVIVDDLALPVAKLRLKGKGSDAGHNGLRSIQELIGGNDYPRLKFGIGDDFRAGQQADFVLSKFSVNERIDMELSIDVAVKMVYSFVFAGLHNTMNNFN